MSRSTSASSSPYYPPRARWRKPVSLLGSQIRRSLNRFGIRWPTARHVFNICLQLMVPGLAFHFTGHRLIAKCAYVAWVLAAMIFLVWLGRVTADLAFLLMISVHGASLSHLILPLTKPLRFASRLIIGGALFVALAVFVYEPARHWFFANVALPLRTSTGAIIVNPRADCSRLARGELVVFRVGSTSGQGLIVRSGYGAGTVLALPGDKVGFEPDKLTINGIAQGRLANMPNAGELAVPEKSWLIWPEAGIQIYGEARGEVLAQQLLDIALVDQPRLVGKPYKRWFGRKQLINEPVR